MNGAALKPYSKIYGFATGCIYCILGVLESSNAFRVFAKTNPDCDFL